MKQLGFGVINKLFGDGNKTALSLQAALGHTISGVVLQGDELILVGLNNGQTLRITDEGQSCCERRYITTDADLPSYIGRKIVDFQLRSTTAVEDAGFDNDDGYEDCHEMQVLVIVTDEGNIDFVTHNEHNGYYGGFSISASIGEPSIAGLQ